MILHRLLIFLCLLLVRLSVPAAAPVELSGRIVDAITGEPVGGAVVKYGSKFSSTDTTGKFRIDISGEADSVTIRCIGYETLTLSASAGMKSIALARKATRLKDVIVEAPDIYARGDTLVFNVARYAMPPTML